MVIPDLQMPVFKAKKVSIETLGEYLRHARTVLNWSLADVCRLTKIPEKHLKNLEEGNYHILPADVYVKGFLKSLAAVYRVPVTSLLEQLEKERGVEANLQKGGLTNEYKRTVKPPVWIITPRMLTIVLVIALALVSLGYLIWQVASISAPPFLEVIFPAGDTTVTSRSMLLRGKTEIGSRVYVNEQEILVEENGGFQSIINLVDGVNSIVVRAENKFGNSSAVKRAVAVEASSGSVPTTTDMIAPQVITVIVIVGPEEAWLLVKTDGKIVQDSVVAAGGKQTFQANSELLLTTGNAGSTRLYYNGKDLGILGRPGELLSNIQFSR